MKTLGFPSLPIVAAAIAVTTAAMGAEFKEFEQVVWRFPFPSHYTKGDGGTVALKPEEEFRFRFKSMSRDRIDGIALDGGESIFITSPPNSGGVWRYVRIALWRDGESEMDLRRFIDARIAKLEAGLQDALLKRIDDSDWPDEIKIAVKEGRLVVGMTEEQVTLAWGKPKDALTSTDAHGESRNLYYPNKRAYINNGRLTSFSEDGR